MPQHFIISVIVPFYNAEFFLAESLNSLVAQNFNLPFEVIMVDDGSTDNSLSIIKKTNQSYIKVFSLPSNSGPAAARNLGLKKARGDYVFFLDADDTIEPDTLSSLYKSASEANADLVFCDSKWIEKNKNQRLNIFSFLKDTDIELDEVGFVKTNDELMTTMDGVFASGDVRSGATMQIASAVGEGATAALRIREYLEHKEHGHK